MRAHRISNLPRSALALIALLAVWAIAATLWVIFGSDGRSTDLTELVAPRTKIVVLPFENLGLPDDEYFADGLTEEITARLSEIPELGVISRTTAIRYKNSTRSAVELGEELDVDYVLEGTVRWDHLPNGRSTVRVTPQLIRVADDTHVWAEPYEAVISQIFQVQSDIAENVARALDITLLEPLRRQLEAQPTANLEAYDYYLRGNGHYSRRFVEDDAWRAVEMYEQAVELDPTFAHAYAALSRALVWINQQFGRSGTLPQARDAVDLAIRLAPELVEAHMAMGDYYYYGRLDYPQALQEYEWVLRRQPSNSDALALTAWIERRRGDWEKSIAYADRALELDPRNEVWITGQAQNYFYMRDYELAEAYFLRVIALAPDVPYYYRYAAWMYLAWDGSTERAHSLLQSSFVRFDPLQLLVGSEASWIILNVFGQDYAAALEDVDLEAADIDPGFYYLAKAQISSQRDQEDRARIYYDSARVVFEARIAEGPEHLAPHSQLGIAYAGLGRAEDAVRAGRLGVQLRPTSRDAIVGPDRVIDLARIYVMVGQYEAAIELLDRVLSVPGPVSPALLRVDPFWDPLRSYPRFQMLLESDNWREQDQRPPTRVIALR